MCTLAMYLFCIMWDIKRTQLTDADDIIFILFSSIEFVELQVIKFYLIVLLKLWYINVYNIYFIFEVCINVSSMNSWIGNVKQLWIIFLLLFRKTKKKQLKQQILWWQMLNQKPLLKQWWESRHWHLALFREGHYNKIIHYFHLKKKSFFYAYLHTDILTYTFVCVCA